LATVRTQTLSDSQRTPGARDSEQASSLAARLPRLAPEARRVSAFVNGVHGRRKAGPGETFWQYRMLSPGESAGGIDWRRSARENRLYVKEREWEASHTIWMWADRSGSMGFKSSLAQSSKVDRGLVLALALADALVDSGERVGLLGLTRPIASRRVVERLVENISNDKAGLSADLPPARAIGRLDEVLLISDWLTPLPKVLEALGAIGVQGGRGHLVMIVDPVEETFPFAGQAELLDVESDMKLDVGDANAWGKEYRIRIAAHRDAIASACRKLGWTFTIHRTDRNASEAALRLAGLISSARDMRAA
jgi:uncharacterized protein (DUF58 family)